MLDYVIRSGTVIDGTGEPGRLADIGIRDGRIVAIGQIDETGTTEFDAGGLIVMPGVVDPHTHYDAQLFWDPLASPSNVHGVTTVIGGNCGFTLAPINAEDADYIRQMMAKVEGMPLAALENGVPWNWSTFGEYLDRLEGRLGVNAGFLVGHCALRRKVMGADRGEEVATDDEIAAMRALLGRVPRRRRAGVLLVPVAHPLRRRRPPHQLALRRSTRDARLLRGGGGPRGHHARVHHQRLPGLVHPRGDRPDDHHERHRPAAAQLERPDRRRPFRRPHRASAVRLVRRSRRRRADRRPDHADARPHEHELSHPLRALPHSGVGRRHGAPRGGADAPAGRPRRPRPARRAGAQQGGRGLPRAGPLGHLRDRGHLRAGQRGVRLPHAWPTSRPNGARLPSTPSSTSSWPTTCAPCCGPTPTTAKRPPGRCGRRSGATRAPWSGAPMPARTSTACAARAIRPPSSATACAAASSCRSRRRCTC